MSDKHTNKDSAVESKNGKADNAVSSMYKSINVSPKAGCILSSVCVKSKCLLSNFFIKCDDIDCISEVNVVSSCHSLASIPVGFIKSTNSKNAKTFRLLSTDSSFDLGVADKDMLIITVKYVKPIACVLLYKESPSLNKPTKCDDISVLSTVCSSDGKSVSAEFDPRIGSVDKDKRIIIDYRCTDSQNHEFSYYTNKGTKTVKHCLPDKNEPVFTTELSAIDQDINRVVPINKKVQFSFKTTKQDAIVYKVGTRTLMYDNGVISVSDKDVSKAEKLRKMKKYEVSAM